MTLWGAISVQLRRASCRAAPARWRNRGAISSGSGLVLGMGLALAVSRSVYPGGNPGASRLVLLGRRPVVQLRLCL